MTRKGDKLTTHMPSTCLLFPEASIDDAATQVVHPLPLYDVIKDKLPACRRSQLTWKHSPAWKGLFISFVVQSSSLFVLHGFCFILCVFLLPGMGETFSRATHRKSPTFSLRTSKFTPFLWSSLTSSCLRWWLPLETDQLVKNVCCRNISAMHLHLHTYPVVSMKSTQRIIS